MDSFAKTAFKNNILAYYKGISIPVPKQLLKDILIEIKKNKQENLPSYHFFEELNDIEKALRENSKKGFSIKTLTKACEMTQFSDVPHMIANWVFGIAILIERKELENDNLNGWLAIDVKNEQAVVKFEL